MISSGISLLSLPLSSDFFCAGIIVAKLTFVSFNLKQSSVSIISEEKRCFYPSIISRLGKIPPIDPA